MQRNSNIKIDPHTHSGGISWCSKITNETLIDQRIAQGYDGLILTNHCRYNYYQPHEHAEFIERVIADFRQGLAYAQTRNFRFMLGLEVTLETAPQSGAYEDWLLYGVTEDFLRRTPCLYTLTQKQLFTLCRNAGVLLVQAHPFRNGKKFGRQQPGDTAYMHGIEINCTPGDLETREEVLCLAAKSNLLVTCGTDYHGPDRTFRGGMLVPKWVNTSVDFARHLQTTENTTLFFETEVLQVPAPKDVKERCQPAQE